MICSEIVFISELRSSVIRKELKKEEMGSSYFGEPNMGNNDQRGGGSGSSSSSSSRKGKKSNSEKPKQPQRGLGVAQLEKIRLHGQMGCANYHPSLHTTPYSSTFNHEETRLQTAYSSIPSSSFSSSSTSSSSSVSYGFHPNIMMGLGEYERANIIYGDSQLSTTPRWSDPSNSILETQHFVQPSMSTRHLLNPPALLEDSHHKKSKKHRSDSMGSSSQNSESSDTQDLDLELRLSL